MTPPPAAAARLDSVPLPLPEKKSIARKVPARADRPFKGIALILASTIFLGTSDVTAKYLSATLPSIEITWIRFLTFALIMAPAIYLFVPVLLPLDLVPHGLKKAVAPKIVGKEGRGFVKVLLSELESALERAVEKVEGAKEQESGDDPDDRYISGRE